LRGSPLSQEELDANAVALVSVDPDSIPSDNLVVLKPLAVSGGGMKHVGGDVWAATSDPGHLCLLGYLEGDGSADVVQACAQATPNN